MGRTRAGCVAGRKARFGYVWAVVIAAGACDNTTGTVDTAAPEDSLEDAATSPPDAQAPADTADLPELPNRVDAPDTAPDPDLPELADTAHEDSELADTDSAEPPTLWLTVAQIPPSMNGSRPAQTPAGPLDYTLRVNRAQFELDLVATDADWSTLDLSCAVEGLPLTLPEPGLPSSAASRAGPDFAPGASWRQLTLQDLPAGRVTCAATIAGPHGGAQADYAFDAADLPPSLDPFGATDIWLVQTRRDRDRLEASVLPDGTVELRSTAVDGGDGVDDFDAPFYELGLMSRAHPEHARLVRDQLLRRVRSVVQAIYHLGPDGLPQGGVDLAIHFEGDPSAPAPSAAVSRIALTGDGALADQLSGTFGRALIDWNNQRRDDNTRAGLGVWPTALARALLRHPLGLTLLEPYRPATGGVPFGAHPDDLQFLGRDDVDPAALTGTASERHAIYALAIELGGMALASILAHEIGHSLGLVPPGAPPEGLFAGVAADFVVTPGDDAHIDLAGLNVMQTGGNLNVAEALSGEIPRFEPLSWAYLRRQLVVGQIPTSP